MEWISIVLMVLNVIFSIGPKRQKRIKEFKKYMKARSSEQGSSIDSLNQADAQMDEFERLDNESKNKSKLDAEANSSKPSGKLDRNNGERWRQ